MVRPSQISAASPLPQPKAAEVRAHLDKLMHSEALAISDRNRRFLAYIVEETLAGRGDRIKAYNVALTAFDRTDDFDPQTDPIVRIEASRLRRALEHYYLTAGKADALRIGIPKGSYVATFSQAEIAPAAPPETEAPVREQAETEPRLRPVMPMRKPTIWWIASIAAMLLVILAWMLPILIEHAVGRAKLAVDGPSLLILPFETGDSQSHAFIARGITAEVIGRLTALDTLSVLGQQAVKSDPAIEPDYILSGSTHTVGSKIYVSAVLADWRTGRYLWSWNVERDLTGPDLIGVEAAIAGEIAAGIKPMIHAAAD
jgi:TolB-like protein